MNNCQFFLVFTRKGAYKHKIYEGEQELVQGI